MLSKIKNNLFFTISLSVIFYGYVLPKPPVTLLQTSVLAASDIAPSASVLSALLLTSSSLPLNLLSDESQKHIFNVWSQACQKCNKIGQYWKNITADVIVANPGQAE